MGLNILGATECIGTDTLAPHPGRISFIQLDDESWVPSLPNPAYVVTDPDPDFHQSPNICMF